MRRRLVKAGSWALALTNPGEEAEDLCVGVILMALGELAHFVEELEGLLARRRQLGGCCSYGGKLLGLVVSLVAVEVVELNLGLV